MTDFLRPIIFIASFSSLYIAMGFFGYLKYGSDIASTITLNMDLVCFYLLFLFFISNPQTINMDLSPSLLYSSSSSENSVESYQTMALFSSSFLPFLLYQQSVYCRMLHWPRLLLECSALPSSSPTPFRFIWATKSHTGQNWSKTSPSSSSWSYV